MNRRTTQEQDQSQDERHDDFSTGQEGTGSEFDDEELRGEFDENSQGGGDDGRGAGDDDHQQDDQQTQQTDARQATQTQQATETQQQRGFSPQYRQAGYSAEERQAKLASISQRVASLDPDDIAAMILDTAEEISARRATAELDNYMAAQVHTATDQIEAIAQRNLYSAARNDPSVLNNPKAVEVARYGAALQYGMETGDIYGAIEKIHGQRRERIGEDRQQQQRQNGNGNGADRQDRARDRDTGQFIPIPSGNGNGGVSGGRRTGSRTMNPIKEALPFVPDDDLREVFH